MWRNRKVAAEVADSGDHTLDRLLSRLLIFRKGLTVGGGIALLESGLRRHEVGFSLQHPGF